MISGKTWGATEDLLTTPFVELHRITIDPNYECSNHKHEFKSNLFYVIEGELFIETEKNDYALTDVTRLGPGDFTSVPPNEFHKFVTKEKPCVALEIYYPQPIGKDIVRKNVGGEVGKQKAEKI